MAKIIEILGNSGSGKTTLVAELLKTGLFSTGIEEHEIRPFHQASVETNSAVALANQVDFLLYRAEQEKKLREGSKTGLLDGGLEQDFFLFTRLFREKGYLDEPSYQVCQRLYRFFRESLGAPNLILWIDLPVSEVVARFKSVAGDTKSPKLQIFPGSNSYCMKPSVNWMSPRKSSGWMVSCHCQN